MPVQLQTLHKRGGTASIWIGTDSLGRKVAVKVISKSSATEEQLIDQAKALARACHHNVVVVHTLDDAVVPGTSESVHAVVMEYIEGQTISEIVHDGASKEWAIKVSGQLIDGIERIHQVGLVHGDLHDENVLVTKECVVKIIDIHYVGTLAAAPTQSREQNRRSDLEFVQRIIRRLLNSSDASGEAGRRFAEALVGDLSVASLRAGVSRASGAMQSSANGAAAAEYMLGRLRDPHYVSTQEYAIELAKGVDDASVEEVVRCCMRADVVGQKHGGLFSALWPRLDPGAKRRVLSQLSPLVDAVSPESSFVSALVVLRAFGEEGWLGISPAARIRLENVITADILRGAYSGPSSIGTVRGLLGTWATAFFARFSDKAEVSRNIEKMLLSNAWEKQNYIGKFFASSLHAIAVGASRESQIVEALRVAAAKEPYSLIENLHHLPSSWGIKKPDPPEGEIPF